MAPGTMPKRCPEDAPAFLALPRVVVQNLGTEDLNRRVATLQNDGESLVKDVTAAGAETLPALLEQAQTWT
eukprot:15456897-Alexandrium_andersonii.AAC.1